MAHPRGFRGRTTKRATAWGVGSQELDGAMSATSKTLWSSGIVTQDIEVTLIRTRGFVHYFLNAATAQGDGFFGAVGLGVTTQLAFNAGSGSIPGPFTQSDWDGWFWHQFFDVRLAETSLFNSFAHQRIEIDSKAMRKLGLDLVVFGMTEGIESGTAVLEMHGDPRMLFKV